MIINLWKRASLKISSLLVWYSIFEVHSKTQSESCKKSSQAIWKMDDIQCSFAASLTLSALHLWRKIRMQRCRFFASYPFGRKNLPFPPRTQPPCIFKRSRKLILMLLDDSLWCILVQSSNFRPQILLQWYYLTRYYGYIWDQDCIHFYYLNNPEAIWQHLVDHIRKHT